MKPSIQTYRFIFLVSILAFFSTTALGQSPAAVFSESVTFGCPNMAVTFSDSSTSGFPIVSWNWDFGDGTTSTLQNPTHTYASSGAHTVSLTVTDMAGVSDMMTKHNLIKVATPPSAVFSASSNQPCVPYYLHLNNQSAPGTSAIQSWGWDFGNGVTSSVQYPQNITYNTAGQYAITLTLVDSNNCYSVATANLTVNSPPVANFTVNTNLECAKVPLQFTDLSSSSAAITGHYWTFGDGSVAHAANPTFTYAHGGVYDVTLNTFDANGCTGTKSVTQYMTIKEAPDADFTSDKTIGKFNLGVNFSDLSTADTTLTSWFWDFGDGNTSTLHSDYNYYRNPGKYDVSLTVTNARGCRDTYRHDDYIWVRVPLYNGGDVANLKSMKDVNQSNDASRIFSPRITRNDIRVSPNPFREGPLNIYFPKQVGDVAEISLYNSKGHLIQTTFENVYPGMIFTWEIPEGLPSGFYHLSVKSGRHTYQKKLVKR